MTTLPVKHNFKSIHDFIKNKIKANNPDFPETLLNNLELRKTKNNTLSLNWNNVNARIRNPINELTINKLTLKALLDNIGLSDNIFNESQKNDVISKLPDGLKHLYIDSVKSLHVELDIDKYYRPFTLSSLSDINTQNLLSNETATIKLKGEGINPYYPFRPIKLSELSLPPNVNNNQKQDLNTIQISELGDIRGEDTGGDNGYKFLLFPDSVKEVRFKTSRTLSWLTFSLFNEGNNSYLYSIGICDNNANTGKVVRWKRGGFDVLSNTPSNDEIMKKPFNKNIPIGTIVRLEITNNNWWLNIYLTRPNQSEVHWLRIKRGNPRFRTQNRSHEFNRLGLCLGVSPAETADDGTKTLYHREIMIKEENNTWVVPNTSTDNNSNVEKYAILVTGGQSNMVGYDESLVDLSDYPEDERLKQWGIYGNDKNQIIPLSVHAHAYQDMRPFSNPNNPQPNLGTKGIHYPLAKLLKEQLKQIPEDYKIIVINGSFGSTWFGSNDGENGLDDTGYIPRSLTSKARWGVNSSYYLSIKKRVQKIFEDYPASKLIGFVWCQGEHENVRNFDGYTAMRNDFISYVSSIPLDRRFIRDPQKNIFFMDSCSKWKKIPEYNRYMDMIKQRVHSNGTFVEIPITTDTNLVNGTGRTTSDREAHFGNNAYKNVIAPLVFESIKNIIDNQ